MSTPLPPPGKFRTTAEIRDAHFHQRLARRRRLMLAWSLPVLIIAFLAAAKLLSAVVINLAGTSAYDTANTVSAAGRFESLQFFNVVQPWKAHFNHGTAVYATGAYFSATESFEVALEMVPQAPEGEPRAPEECAVRTNYSLALEGLGDEASIASDFTTATDYYAQAQEMLADCGESGGNGTEESQEAEQRQQESQEQSEQQQESQEQQDGEKESPTPSEGASGESQSPTPGQGKNGESQSPAPTTDPRQEELKNRNQEAQKSREASERGSGGGNGSGQNW